MLLFIDNKYTRTYAALMARASSRILPTEYTEIHHKIPRSMGGGDESNLVRLTGREHFIAHLLLPKAVMPEFRIKMEHALWAMSNGFGPDKRWRPTSRQFSIIREQYARIARDNGRQRVGKFNPASKPCYVQGKMFHCMTDAIRVLNFSSKHALRSDPTFYLVNEDGSLDPSIRFTKKKRKPMSEEQREKLRVLAIGRKCSEDTKTKLSRKLSGRESPRKGKPASEVEKRKKSKPIEFRGIQYFGLTEACERTGLTAYFIKKDPTFKRFPK